MGQLEQVLQVGHEDQGKPGREKEGGARGTVVKSDALRGPYTQAAQAQAGAGQKYIIRTSLTGKLKDADGIPSNQATT